MLPCSLSFPFLFIFRSWVCRTAMDVATELLVVGSSHLCSRFGSFAMVVVERGNTRSVVVYSSLQWMLPSSPYVSALQFSIVTGFYGDDGGGRIASAVGGWGWCTPMRPCDVPHPWLTPSSVVVVVNTGHEFF